MADSAASNTTSCDNTQSESADRTDSSKSNIKYEWYQTNTHVTVSLLVKNVKPGKMKIDIHQQSLSATVETDKEIFNKLEINLAHEIVPTQSTSRILTSKVEIKLSKRYAEHWSNLERAEVPTPFKPISCTRKWDQVVETELKDDKAESDAALTELFQKIYSQGSDEVKKAMNKSFLESGGTVLSTNWKEVARDTVEVKPPDGMEWKKWDT